MPAPQLDIDDLDVTLDAADELLLAPLGESDAAADIARVADARSEVAARAAEADAAHWLDRVSSGPQ